ncbi:MAG TPA: outer membrane beta-barrel protein, partial [Gammaproteobacteria bacterium]|nr:outer membrane beta-barrel protein [Gammaproteobacteria bacterium]
GSGGGGTIRTTGSGIGGLSGFSSNGQGITATQSAGLNYNNFKKSNLELTSSYFFNGTQLKNDYATHRETFVSDSSQLLDENGYSNRDNYNHRINAAVDWKIDSNNSIKITPSVSIQNTNSYAGKTFVNTGAKGGILSTGNNLTSSQTDGYNINVNALYRHRFARKGRTFSAELRVGANQSEGEGTQFTVNSWPNYNGGGPRTDTLVDQQNFTDNESNTLGVTLRYTEPMSRRSLLEFSAYHNENSNQRDQRTYDLNDATNKYDIENARLTNLISNDYRTSGAGLKFRENRTGWNYTIGADLQRAELSSLLQGKSAPITQDFLNLLPNAQVQIGKNRYRNFRIIYNGTTQNPSVTQLQPIEDISNPLNIKRGNPDLKQSFINNFRVNYTSFDPYTMKSFFAFVNMRQTFNAIVNNDSIFTNGGALTTYENADGVYSMNANVNFGLPVNIGGARANMNFGTGAGL